MSQCYLEAVRECDQTVNPLFRFLGARLALAEAGKAVIVMPITGNLRQGGGKVAGGILATLADESMAHAVLSLLDPCQDIVTVEMNIRYLRSADPDKGGELLASAEVVKNGRTLTMASAEVHDSTGRLLATAGATFHTHPGRPVSQNG